MLSAEGQRSRGVSQLDEMRAISSLHRLAGHRGSPRAVDQKET